MSIGGIVPLLLILLGVFLIAALIASRGAELDEKLAILAASLVIWGLYRHGIYNCHRRMHYVKGD